MLKQISEYGISLKAAKDAVEASMTAGWDSPKIPLIKMLRDAARRVAEEVYEDVVHEINWMRKAASDREERIEILEGQVKRVLDTHPADRGEAQHAEVEQRVQAATADIKRRMAEMGQELDAAQELLAQALDDVETFKNALRRAL